MYSETFPMAAEQSEALKDVAVQDVAMLFSTMVSMVSADWAAG